MTMHGGNLRRAQELYGLDSFIDLSANINPFGPPPGVWTSLKDSLKDIVNYPDPECQALRSALSEHLGLPKNRIMIGNGAGELIFTIVQALKPTKVVIPIPTFSEYERAARSVGAEVSYIPLGPAGWTNDQQFSEQMWRKSLAGCDLLFLCSPHNPTGSVLARKTFEQILQITQEIGCRVLFDESFLDFLPLESRQSARCYLAAYEHLIVLYSLTKFYSLPGLRLGTVFAQPALLTLFEKYRDPWSVNVLAQQAGIASLQDTHYPNEVREKLKESRTYFYHEFEHTNLTNLKLWPTLVNFSLIEVINPTSGELIRSLGDQGILVRNCANFAGLPSNFIRVAIKDIPVMQKLIAGLQEFYTINKM